MNGRLERMDGRLESFSEPNHSIIDFFFDEERRRKWKHRGVNALWFLGLNVCLWIVVEGFGRGL